MKLFSYKGLEEEEKMKKMLLSSISLLLFLAAFQLNLNHNEATLMPILEFPSGSLDMITEITGN